MSVGQILWEIIRTTWSQGRKEHSTYEEKLIEFIVGHILRKTCFLKHVTERKRSGGRRRKQLINGLKENRRCWNLKVEALDRTTWRLGFWKGYGLEMKERMNEEWISESFTVSFTSGRDFHRVKSFLKPAYVGPYRLYRIMLLHLNFPVTHMTIFNTIHNFPHLFFLYATLR
jgi:hypothetical protein